MRDLNTTGLSASVGPKGITAPDYPTLLHTLTDRARKIVGEDAYLEPDSKDGQLLAIFALALHEANNAIIAAYHSFSPASARGAALSNNVQINGIARHAASRSTVDVRLTGVVGTRILNGMIRDISGYAWSLPAEVVIGTHGEAVATATCQTLGKITALPGAVSVIGTPTQGWQTVSNPATAAPGQPIESDTALRDRQRKSVSLPSRTVLDGIQAAISLIPGVIRQRGFENDTGRPDARGLPAHAIAMIVEGGDVQTIARTIALKKGPGATTFGDTTLKIADTYGVVHDIAFSRPKDITVWVEITLTAFVGYTTLVGDNIKTAVARYINAQKIGDPLYLSRLFTPANLPDSQDGMTYDVTEIRIGRTAAAMTAKNLDVAFDEAVTCQQEHIQLILTSL